MTSRAPERLADQDPWVEVEAARAARRRAAARWLLTAWRGRVKPGRKSTPMAALPPGCMRLLPMLPLAASYALSYLFRNVNGVVAPDIMRSLGIGADGLGLMTSVAFLVFAASQLPVGVLLDRYGPARVQSVLLLCAAAGSALTAASEGFAGLIVGRALIGLGTSGSLVAGLKAAVAWFPPDRLARINGGLVMCGGVGALLATWPVELMLRFVDWRGLAAVLAALALACAFAVGRFVPRSPEPPVVQAYASLGSIVRDPLFRRFAPLSASCFGTVLAVQGLWAGPWLADVDRLSRSEVASELATMAAVLVVAAPCWGLATQWLRRRISLARAAAGAAVVILAAEALLLTHPGLPSLLPWCLFASFGGMTVLSYSVLADHFPASTIGRANGALNVAHIGVSFLVQLGIGKVVSCWPSVAGHYPAAAYKAALLLPVTLQLAALVWFAWPGLPLAGRRCGRPTGRCNW